MRTIPLLCFNDVYRVNQKYNPQPGAPEDDSSDRTITVSQFAELLLSERSKWGDRQSEGGDDQEGPSKEGLVLFAGDVFNPSVESSVTRGSHMVSYYWEMCPEAPLSIYAGSNHECSEGRLCMCRWVLLAIPSSA